MKKILLALGCIIFGPFFAWQGLSDAVTATLAKSWPTVQGTISFVDIKKSTNWRRINKYSYVIKYDYEVDGNKYIGDRIDNGDRGGSSIDKVMTTLSRYEKGDTVKVYYNKKSPETSLLEVGTTSDNWWVLFGGILITGIGIFIARDIWQDFQSNDFTT
mgnify:CR=1 FL=1